MPGNGFCNEGNAFELEFGDEGAPDIGDVIDFGNSIYLDTLAVQAYSQSEGAPAPAPVPVAGATLSAG